MSASFSAERLAEMLARIDPSQASIETLSHWCVFNSRYCRQVVETWDCEFRKAPCDRRKSLLYLANDIMQNTRKESDGGYIAEFMRVIPGALNEVYDTGDDSGRTAVKRLVGIWEDRKIFDSQEQSVRDGYLRSLKDLRKKLEKSEELLEKVVLNYRNVLNATKDEDNLLQKCKASIGIFDNLNKAYEKKPLFSCGGSRFVKELQEQRSIIRNSIEKLKVSESLRTTLISHLKEAFYDQELQVTQVIFQLQEAQERYKKANEICQKLGIDVEEHQPSDQGLKRSTFSETFATCFTHSDVGKRQKVEDGTSISQPQSQPPSRPPPPPPFPHPDTLQPPPPPPEYPYSPEPRPVAPPPTSAAHNIIPPPPLVSVPHHIISPISPITGPFEPFFVGPAGGLVTRMPYGHFSSYPPAVSFPMANMPLRVPSAPNPPPAFQGSGGMFYGPPPYPTAVPPMYRGARRRE